MTQPDILGAPYTAETIDLGSDAEGPLAATLVHRPAAGQDAGAATGAVLYLHGFVDYFFQRELGDWWADRGYDFYALDLRKYGRSLRPGQTPYYTENLEDYFQEISESWRLITERDGHRSVILTGHSTGGLTASLWADRFAPTELTALVLNSPWLDHFNNPLVRAAATGAIASLARVKPRTIVQKSAPDPYARSLHVSTGGAWDFNTDWKTLNFPNIYAGWLVAVRRAHARLQRGLNIGAPVLVLTSARSERLKAPGDRHDFDAILNVRSIRRWAPTLGAHVTSRVIDGAIHDIFLSAPTPRQAGYAALGDFVDALPAR